MFFKTFEIFVIFFSFIFGMASGDKPLKFHQSDYKIKLERVELISYDKQYVNYIQIVNYKYNRTAPVVNITVEYNMEVGYNYQFLVQAYKFLSNEYRYFPIRLQINACESIKNNVIGLGSLTRCGNFSGCPIRKGVRQHSCKWSIDETEFPPLIPDGKYMLEIQQLYLGKVMATVRGFGIINRPISWN